MNHTETNDTAATMAAPGAPVASGRAVAKAEASQKKGTPRRPKKAAGGKVKAASKRKPKVAKTVKPAGTTKSAAPRAESKSAQILTLIGRAKGATLAEIQKTTGWQPHSVRGFLSTAAKKQGLQIESTKTEGGDRVYQIRK